ncbi:hypothetical protein L1987_80428 [Smallanthus sonchifolius]|uniref:Uncharacterized protein n=2 Tax=Smallanthus sonchifolius TaxID=185202 RepID=A0ACB8YN93_9ASTR|nr:hypothetical protein L1987_80426 [Smallanthus sonchifolius]KAI3686744.1 hypothetical protein L1987_80428 [Smallanthus sonchifolius]
MFNAEGRTFRDTLVGNKGSQGGGRLVTVANGVRAFDGVHGRAIVATMIDLEALKKINLIIKEIGGHAERVQFLGGLSVLISFKENKEAEDFMVSAREALGRFSSISLWEGQMLEFERFVWLKIQGIPLHLQRNEVIDSVGGVFGVMTGDGRRLDDEVVLQWQNNRVDADLNIEVEEDLDSKEDNESNLDVGEGDGRPEVGNPLELEPIAGDLDRSDIHGTLPMMESLFLGILFPFDNFIGESGSFKVGNSQVCKRKKCKKYTNLGRPNAQYSSSIENIRDGKRARANYPFGLNSLLGLEDEPGSEQDPNSNGEDFNIPGLQKVEDTERNFVTPVTATMEAPEVFIDLNCDLGRLEEPRQSEVRREEEPSILLNPVTVFLENQEVEATKALGEIVGAKLANFDYMIEDSIAQERSQLGKP